MSFNSSIPYTFIDTPEEFEKACDRLRSQPGPFALDTEFWREKTYYAELALLQVCDGSQSYLFDPLKLNLQSLFDLFTEKKALLIFHSPSQDLEILFQRFEFKAERLFDTQLAATLTGAPLQISLHQVLNEQMEIDLAKTQTISKWMKRPLSQKQLEYAHEDVAYLIPLHDILKDKLQQFKREAVFEEECQFYNFVKDPLDSIIDKHNHYYLSDYSSEIIKKLFSWRENLARSKNLPRNWLLKDKQLTKIAHHTNHREWKALLILSPKEYQNYSKELIGIIDSCSTQAKSKKVTSAVKHQINELSAHLQKLVKDVAQRESLPPEFIINNRNLLRVSTQIMLKNLRSNFLSGWRGELINDTFERALKRDFDLKN